jgi:hypothetical protein
MSPGDSPYPKSVLSDPVPAIFVSPELSRECREPIGPLKGHDHGFCCCTPCFRCYQVAWTVDAACGPATDGQVVRTTHADATGAGQPVRLADADCGSHGLTRRTPIGPCRQPQVIRSIEWYPAAGRGRSARRWGALTAPIGLAGPPGRAITANRSATERFCRGCAAARAPRRRRRPGQADRWRRCRIQGRR